MRPDLPEAMGPGEAAPQSALVPAPQVTLVGDLACPWCYIALARLLRLRARSPFGLCWHPLLLNAHLPPEGVPRGLYAAVRPGSQRQAAALERRASAIGAAEGLQFWFAQIARQPNTILANAFVLAAGQRGPELAFSLNAAFFAGGADIGAEDVLERLGARFGADPATARAATPEVMQAHRSATRFGVDGVPITIFGRDHMIGGTQPIECLEALLDLERVRVSAPPEGRPAPQGRQAS